MRKSPSSVYLKDWCQRNSALNVTALSGQVSRGVGVREADKMEERESREKRLLYREYGEELIYGEGRERGTALLAR